ncbi:hypothetical protein JOM56_003101 [Amanita muscaria]
MAAYPSPPFYIDPNNYQYPRPQHGYHQNPYSRHQQQQQQQQHYPPKYPQPYPHHPHHPGYSPYQPQPQTPQGAGSPNFGPHPPPWQPHGPHGLGHQGPLSPLPLLQQQHHHVPRVMSPAYFDLPNQTRIGSPARREHPQAQTGLNLENIEPSTPLNMDVETFARSSMSPASPHPEHIPQHLIQQSQHQQQDPIHQVSTYTQTGTISLTSPAISSTSFSSHTSPVSHTVLIPRASPVASISSVLPPVSIQNISTSTTDARKPGQKAIWAVWSRRPQDPSHAPGIIISPSARPPPDVVKQALDIKTPPQSPVMESFHLEISAPVDDEGGGPPPTPPPQFTTTAVAATTALSNGDTSTVPSSAASMTEGLTDLTNLTDAPTVPGSPASSTTSVSMSGVGVKHHIDSTANEIVEAGSSAPTSPIVVAVITTTVTTTGVEGSVSQIADPETATAVDASLDAAITTIVAGPSTTAAAVASATTAGEASTSSTTAAAAAPVPPVKKSWASLLKPSSSTTPGSSGPSGRNTLPTSNVVGISIPASAMASSASSTSANKAELIALLTNGPSAVGNYASAAAAANNGGAGQMGKLKPRGLVNIGNMCFANSVLQMLVYTVPFQRLFFEIGRLSVGFGKEGKDGKDGSASTTPLVDAMVEFVKEFVVTDAELYEGNAGSGNVTNVTVNGWGKGKEKERERENGDEDELWGTESFLPNYVYEAMKEKKRFDNMRGGQQEDAEEFLGFLLETLEEELVLLKETLTGTSSSSSSGRQETKLRPVEEREEAAPPEERGWHEVGKRNRTVVTRTIKSTESPITKIFGGKFRTTLRVPHTKKDSVIVEDWRSIRLDIQRDQIHTVQDALAYISQPQPVQVTNPARPGTALEAHQVVHIDALPPVLVLHLKRFCYDTSVGGVVKVGKTVTFGPELEIGNDVISHAIRRPQPPKYKLFGALYHHGQSASGGHYTLDVLHPTRFTSPGGRTREGWIRIDDELASDVRHEDVFGGERDDNRSAYLLFYRRIR